VIVFALARTARHRFALAAGCGLVAVALAVAGVVVVIGSGHGAASASAPAAGPAATAGLTNVASGQPYSLTAGNGKLTLLSFLATQPDTAATSSRSQAVVLASLSTQYQKRGLRVAIVDDSPVSATNDALVNTIYDWNLGAVALLSDSGNHAALRYGVIAVPTTLLIDDTGKAVARWGGYLLTAVAVSAITARLPAAAARP
jgi:hypothetical protein